MELPNDSFDIEVATDFAGITHRVYVWRTEHAQVFVQLTWLCTGAIHGGTASSFLTPDRPVTCVMCLADDS
jgi:hypothetical protein